MNIYYGKKIIENRNFFADVNDPLGLPGLTSAYILVTRYKKNVIPMSVNFIESIKFLTGIKF